MHRTAIGFARAADDAAVAARITDADADAALAYRIDAASRVELKLFHAGAANVDEIAGDVPGLVSWNVNHLALIGGAVVLALGVVAVRLLRATGQLDVTIERAPDATDEVYCISVARHAGRPSTSNLSKFHADTKAAGPVTTGHRRTLVGKVTTFKLPTGRWHVNLYGAFLRGGTLRAVPETASKIVEVRRGRTATVAFDLAPTLAEILVQLVVAGKNAGKGATVATTERDKVYADAEGRATLMLAVGNHVLIVEHAGGVLKRPLQVPAARVQRVVIDVAPDKPTVVALGSAPAVPLMPLEESAAVMPSPPPPSDVVVAFTAPGARKRSPSVDLVARGTRDRQRTERSGWRSPTRRSLPRVR